MTSTVHTPVLLKESIQFLGVRPGGRYVDCTLGLGGHTAAILDHSYPGGRVLGIDADPGAIEQVRKKLQAYAEAVSLVNANFVELESLCKKHRFYPADGVLFDLGLSSFALDNDGRGFSFQRDAPLDMRFDPQQNVTAGDLVNSLSEKELASILQKYGEERFSRSIAHRIVEARPLSSTFELVRVIEKATGSRRGKVHPATRTFQALRIAVNRELENLEKVLSQTVRVLQISGRLVVISYHSLEDRIVKNFMRRESRDCLCPKEAPACNCGHQATLVPLTRKVVTPSPEEVALNPRSRSAKLRAAQRNHSAEVEKQVKKRS